jgi:rhamnulokinase
MWSKERPYSFAELVDMARSAPPRVSIIDPDRDGFFNPDNMVSAIDAACDETGEPKPDGVAACVRCILESLALDYRYRIEQLRRLSSRKITRIHIVGGGCQNDLLNQMTADATGCTVHAGPVEATAIGNILVQAMALGQVRSLDQLREIVRRSFPVSTCHPASDPGWDSAYERFLGLKEP